MPTLQPQGASQQTPQRSEAIKNGGGARLQSFDVDDPSSDGKIDPDRNGANSGDDNVGTYDDVDNPRLPGPSDAEGNPGRIRVWKRPTGSNPTGTWSEWGSGNFILSATTDDNGYVFLDLATTFAPGDNFRVAATTDKKEFEAATMQDPPTTGDVDGFDGKLTEQLSVWRYLNIEHDTMTNTESADKFNGTLTASGAPAGGKVQVTVRLTAAKAAHQFVRGILRDTANGVNYDVVASTATDANFDLTVTVNSPNALPVNVAVILYEDDFKAIGDPNAVPTSFVPTENEDGMFDLLKTSLDMRKNVLAAAYIIPVYNLHPEWNDKIGSAPHVSTPLQIQELTIPHRQSAPLESATYWWVYVSTAYEGPVTRDFDPADELAPWLGATAGSEASLVFLNTIDDQYLTLYRTSGFSDMTMRSVLTAHEIGHQLLPGFLGHSDSQPNIMNTTLNAAVFGNVSRQIFLPETIRKFRNLVQPE